VTRQRVMFQADVGVEHRPFNFARPIHSKEIGKVPKSSLDSHPLIVKASLVRSDEIASILDQGAELIALRVAKCGQIGQD
jgi:hypothetical protein